LTLFSTFVGFHYEIGTIYVDMEFSIEQVFISVVLYFILSCMKKSIDCLLGIAMIILSVAINSFIWIYNAPVNLTFFIDYFLTIRGFIYVETPIVVAYGVAWKINKKYHGRIK
jgi:hypothetical protein